MRYLHRSPALVAVATLVLALTIAAGYGSAGAPPAAVTALPSPGFTVRVAMLAPFDGGLASFGLSVRNGVKIAMQTLAPDWTIEIVEKNTGCDGPTAAAAATEVISDGIHYLIGDVCSGSTTAVSELAEENGVLMISPTASAPGITSWPDGSDKEYVFRAIILDDVQGKSMASLATGIGAQSVVVMTDPGNAYSAHLAEVFATHLEMLGVAAPQIVSYSMDDYASAVAQVLAAAPDAVYLPNFESNVNTLLAAARDQGIDVPFLGSDGWDTPILDIAAAEGCYFPTSYVPEDPRPVAADFRAAYVTRFGSEPDSTAAHAYDAMALLITAISEAGVDDATIARDALSGLAYEGVTGRVTFDAIGDPIKTLGIVAIQDGERRLYRHVAPQESRPLEAGTTITMTDPIVALEVPAAITQTLTMTYTPQLATTQETGSFQFEGVSFSLDVADEAGYPVITLSQPLTLTISYTEADLAPRTDEELLAVMRWDVDAAEWVALQVLARDTEANTLTVLLDHLSQFALLGPAHRELFVPWVRH